MYIVQCGFYSSHVARANTGAGTEGQPCLQVQCVHRNSSCGNPTSLKTGIVLAHCSRAPNSALAD